MERVSWQLNEAVNETCPWSGKPVVAEALTLYKGHVVGFCNSDCRNKFEKATAHFEAALSKRAVLKGMNDG